MMFNCFDPQAYNDRKFLTLLDRSLGSVLLYSPGGYVIMPYRLKMHKS